MERRIRRLGIALVLLFALVFGQLAYVQVFAADSIKGNPANFSRQLIAEYNVQRGKILTADGLVLAESVPAPEGSRYRYERRYPQGDLYGYITGYYSRIYGRSALEQSMNTYLSGEAPELAISTFTDLFLGRQKRGANVFVTIDPDLQEVARTALGSNAGRVVAMDPSTGDLLAVYSTPGFDPSELSSGSDAEMRRAWQRLNADPAKPLLASSHQELFLPGSSFKIVTAIGGARERLRTGERVAEPAPARRCRSRTRSSRTSATTTATAARRRSRSLEAFEDSCNVTFAESGSTWGPSGSPRRRARTGSAARSRRSARRATTSSSGSSSRSRTAGSRSPSTSSGTTRSSPSPRSDWTTTW